MHSILEQFLGHQNSNTLHPLEFDLYLLQDMNCLRKLDQKLLLQIPSKN